MELIEIEEERRMQREEAAELLRQLADSLSRHNSVDVVRNGVKLNVKVADQVTVEFELEVESDKSSLEIEISW